MSLMAPMAEAKPAEAIRRNLAPETKHTILQLSIILITQMEQIMCKKFHILFTLM